MVTTQCPLCGKEQPNLTKLARHLSSRRRFKRCGAYTGDVRFVCSCGGRYTRIASIRAHIRTRHNRIRRDQVPVVEGPRRETRREVGFYNLEVLEEHGEVLQAPQLASNATSTGAIDTDVTPVIGATPNALASEAALNGFSYGFFHRALRDDKEMKALCGLYKYCLSSQCTVRIYRELVELDIVDATYQIPKKRQTLRKTVSDFIESNSGWVTMKTFTLPTYKKMHISPTPYMRVRDALRVWLSVPVIFSAVKESMLKYLPENLIDVAAYNDLIVQRNASIALGTHVYECVADGSEYLPAIKSCIPQFQDEVTQSFEDRIEVIVVTISLYEDSYRRQKDSLVNQKLFCVTLLEATVGEVSLTGLATLVLMLADVEGIKAVGSDAYWRIIVDEMCELEKGVRMIIDGKEILVICIGLAKFADTPALKDMAGLSVSTSPICYVRMPCRTCEVVMEELSMSIDGGHSSSLRSIDTYQWFYKCNNYATGVPLSAWVRNSMKEFGITRISEFIRLTGLMSPRRLGTDTMHAVYLGVLKSHFIMVVELLTSTNCGSAITSFDNIWVSISDALHAFCKKNEISCCWKFKSLKQFKGRVKAGSMRVLARASPFIFYVIGLIDFHPADNRPATLRRWNKHLKVFKFWLLHTRIADNLELHCVSSTQLNRLRDGIKELLQYFHDDNNFPHTFATINVHYYTHMYDQITWLGPIRIAANNARERLIRFLKPRYKNTNAVKKEATVYQMYLDHLFFDIQDYCIHGEEAKYQRNVVPDGLVEFDYSRYHEVLVDDGVSVRVVTMGSILCEDPKDPKVKLQYSELRVNDYILLSAGFYFDETYFARFLNIVTYSEEAYIAHTLPEVTAKKTLADLAFEIVTIQDTNNYSTLYLCPLTRFISKIEVMACKSDGEYVIVGL